MYLKSLTKIQAKLIKIIEFCRVFSKKALRIGGYMIVRNIKKIDDRKRVVLPSERCEAGEEVYFDVTKAGHLIVKKVKQNGSKR